ncbi:MAG: DegT/DnrJ/EryC1/StrS aminotransferase family protein [Lachnospiraceae bacterium]|nr:DegT/DnrJ/EryC1/StrS aminotransferase family protein [Lachnospiraceae bacterium]
MEKRIIKFSPPDISEKEIEEVCETLRSGWITTGPRTKLLERRLAEYIKTGRTDVDCPAPEGGAKANWKAVCLNSATAAEELNFKILGIQPGDEVVVPAYSYTASASAAIHCGAVVKFVDIQKDGDAASHMPEMDYEALEKAITEKTKAIVTVDIGGIVCDYDRVFEIVDHKKSIFKPVESDGSPLLELASKIQQGLGCIAVVADCAHSLGASRKVSRTGSGKCNEAKKYCGNIAHFSSFSFHAVKNFTTAEGGASTWCLPQSVYDNGVTDEQIYKMFQLLSLHGQNKDALAKSKTGAWEYDIIGPWYKCNMTDIMAAMGLRQLDRYLGLLARREEIIRKYDAVCDRLKIGHLVHHTEKMDSSNHLYLIRIPGIDTAGRNKIMEILGERGIATNVHYKPLPMMTAYKNLGWDIKDFPNSYDYYRNLITLPLHTLLSDSDVDYICENLAIAVNEIRGC